MAQKMLHKPGKQEASANLRTVIDILQRKNIQNWPDAERDKLDEATKEYIKSWEGKEESKRVLDK